MSGAGDHAAWRRYYAETGGRAPHKAVLLALDRFAAEDLGAGFAVDLGSGSGRDTIEILRRGWRALAIDSEPQAIAALRARADLPPAAALEARIARFEDATWPDAHLVNAGFALPLAPPAAFPRLWRRIRCSLKPGGRFSGQLYGRRHSWHGDPTITFHGRDEVEALLAGLEVEMLDEEEEDSVTPRGRREHWHIFHLVAREPKG